MLNARKVWIVARFELIEALRSRLFIVVMALYGAGAAIGSFAFLKTVQAAERTLRHELALTTGLSESQLPKDLLQEKILPMFSALVEDEATRDALLEMPLLAIFYGYMALNFVALLVLVVSAGTMAQDLQNGSARFALFRTDRLSWATGKLLGQEALLAVGLLVGALLAGTVGALVAENFEPITWVWLMRASLRTWLYGSAYLGIFCGLSLVVRTPLGARALALLTLIVFGIVHGILTADLANQQLPFLHHFGIVFPAHHKGALWSPELASYLPAASALLVIGAVGFLAGHLIFQRRDA
jgi:ABC-type transport system involved in multi-copper enzyme maturation permease subunit